LTALGDDGAPGAQGACLIPSAAIVVEEDCQFVAFASGMIPPTVTGLGYVTFHGAHGFNPRDLCQSNNQRPN
jgi:hypothetical protein